MTHTTLTPAQRDELRKFLDNPNDPVWPIDPSRAVSSMLDMLDTAEAEAKRQVVVISNLKIRLDAIRDAIDKEERRR